MAMTHCAAGLHFYNNETYDKCPSCNPVSSNTVLHQPPPPPNPPGTNGVGSDEPTKPVYIDNKEQSDNSNSDNVTVILGPSEIEVLPVTGWLVIVEGVGKGRDFRLIQGKNKVGLHKKNEVCLTFENGKCDKHVSRDGHVVVYYDNN